MSFSMTTDAVRNRTKTVTRRLGWSFIKPGDMLWAVEKGMGLKKGEKVKRLALIRVVSIRGERLDTLLKMPAEEADLEVEREGFDICPNDFVDFFTRANGCMESSLVNRIEFEYVGGVQTRREP
jgi:hypothetical protein